MNRWTEFVRKWASINNISYACALSKPECRNEYREKYGNRKKLTKKKEKEMMSLEDYDAPDEEVYTIIPKKTKPKKIKPKKNFEMINELKKKQEKIKEFKENILMGAEDVNISKPKQKSNSKKEKQSKLNIEGTENVKSVFEYLVDTFKKDYKKLFKNEGTDVLNNQIDNLKNDAKKRVDAGFTLEMDKKIREFSKDDLRDLARIYDKNLLKQSVGDYVSMSVAPKSFIVPYLLNNRIFEEETPFEKVDYYKLKESFLKYDDKENNIRKKSGDKYPLSQKNREELISDINRYLYKPSVLSLAKELGLVTKKNIKNVIETKKDVAPIIVDALEKGIIDPDTLFKEIFDRNKYPIKYEDQYFLGIPKELVRTDKGYETIIKPNVDLNKYFKEKIIIKS